MRPGSLLLIAMMLLAACSGDDADTAAPESTTTTAAVAVTAPETPSTTDAPNTTTDSIPETADPGLAGTWIAELTHVAVEGPCPSTPTQRGPVVLTQDGQQFTLVFPDEDFDCDPIEACAFAGTIDDLVITGENSGVADAQGGIFHTEFVATWDGADHIDGAGESTYTAEGVICVWDTALVLDRE